ncbi:hypothetical protein ALT1644_60128 [Alteromonas macleodii]
MRRTFSAALNTQFYAFSIEKSDIFVSLSQGKPGKAKYIV